MKFKITIANKDVLLNDAQLAALVDILHGAQEIKNEYIGGSKGDDGTPYAKTVRVFSTMDINLSPLADDYVDTLVLKTRLIDEDKNK